MATSLAWIGDDAPRMEVAHVERRGSGLTAEIRFDEAGFVLEYPGIAMRVFGAGSP